MANNQAPQPAAPPPLEDLYGGDAQAYLAQVAAGNFGAPAPKAAPAPGEAQLITEGGPTPALAKPYKPHYLKEDMVKVRTKLGNEYTVSAEDLDEARAHGAEPVVGNLHVNAREGMKEFNESLAGKALVASTGYLKGMSPFGLSDMAFHAAYGEGAMQGLEQAREDNKILNAASQIAGMGAQFILSSGANTGLAGGAKAAEAANAIKGAGFLGTGALARTAVGQGLLRGGAALGAPMALLNKGAEAAGHLALKGMGSLGIEAAEQLAAHGAGHAVEHGAELAVEHGAQLAAKLPLWKESLVRAVEKGVEGAVDGSVYNAISGLNESAFGDPKEAAEKMAHDFGVGALWGGALGAGIGAFSPLIREGAKKVAKAGTELVDNTREKLRTKLVDLAEAQEERAKEATLRELGVTPGQENKLGSTSSEVKEALAERADYARKELKGLTGGERTLETERRMNQAFEKVHDVNKELDAKKVFRFDNEAFATDTKKVIDRLETTAGASKDAKRIANYITEFEAKGSGASLERLQQQLEWIDRNYPKPARNVTPSEGTVAMREIRDIIESRMLSDGEAAAKLAGQDFVTQHQLAAKEYGIFKDLNAWSHNAEQYAARQPLVSAKDQLFGLMFAAATGGTGGVARAAGALGTTLAGGYVRRNMPMWTANLANKAAAMEIFQNAIRKNEHGIATMLTEAVAGTAAHVAHHTAQHTAFHQILHAVEHGAVAHADDVKHQLEQVNHLAQNETVLHDRVAEMVRPVEAHAPNIAAAMAVNGIEDVHYLKQSSPPPISGPTLLDPHAPMVYRPEDLDKFGRKLAVLTAPVQTIHSAIREGRLTQDHVQTLMARRPTLYAQIVEGAHNEIAKHAETGKTIPYERRVQLETLLQQSIEPTLRPDFVRAMQASKQPMQEPKGAGHAPRGAPSAVTGKTAQGTKTFAERLSEGG